MVQIIDGIRVVADEAITEEEVMSAVAAEKEYWAAQHKLLGEIQITVDGDELVIRSLEKSPIKRIRRITGYLSTDDRFNDAKQAELADRVNHFV